MDSLRSWKLRNELIPHWSLQAVGARMILHVEILEILSRALQTLYMECGRNHIDHFLSEKRHSVDFVKLLCSCSQQTFQAGAGDKLDAYATIQA